MAGLAGCCEAHSGRIYSGFEIEERVVLLDLTHTPPIRDRSRRAEGTDSTRIVPGYSNEPLHDRRSFPRILALPRGLPPPGSSSHRADRPRVPAGTSGTPSGRASHARRARPCTGARSRSLVSVKDGAEPSSGQLVVRPSRGCSLWQPCGLLSPDVPLGDTAGSRSPSLPHRKDAPTTSISATAPPTLRPGCPSGTPMPFPNVRGPTWNPTECPNSRQTAG